MYWHVQPWAKQRKEKFKHLASIPPAAMARLSYLGQVGRSRFSSLMGRHSIATPHVEEPVANQLRSDLQVESRGLLRESTRACFWKATRQQAGAGGAAPVRPAARVA